MLTVERFQRISTSITIHLMKVELGKFALYQGKLIIWMSMVDIHRLVQRPVLIEQQKQGPQFPTDPVRNWQ